jgi:hypothetical protein
MTHMKSIFAFTFLFLGGYSFVMAQGLEKVTARPRFFNRSELSYTFGLNETFPGDKTNALHVKTIIGFALPKVGFGLGLESGSYKSANSYAGANFNTLAFSGNLHVLAKPITERGVNFFLKGGAGYAVKIFNGYNKGLTYEGAAGLMITTKSGSRYFLQGIYHYQEINDFNIQSTRPIIKSFGAGIGTWF